MDPPKCTKPFLILECPILQEIVNISGSPHLVGNFLSRIAETFSPTTICSFPLNFFLLMHKFFKNCTHFGTCLIASNRGMLISTLRNISNISFSLSCFFELSNLLGKKGGLVLISMIGSGSTTKFLQFLSFSSSSFSIFSSSLFLESPVQTLESPSHS